MSAAASEITVAEARSPGDIEAVRGLCWDYRAFLLANSPRDREITETFYPEPRYAEIMADLPRLHARPRGVMLLARNAEGVAVGCGMTHPLSEDRAEIKRVFVSEAARGAGLARRLCKRLVEQARADGYRSLVLDTSTSLKAAQRLYDRLGFRQRGPYQPIPEDVLPDLLFYELAL